MAHVQYILLAEFELKRGTTLKHQFPSPTGADEQTLAELMVPEGSQHRSEDWTIFYLNGVDELTVNDSEEIEDEDEDGQSSHEGAEGTSRKKKKRMLYVLSLMRNRLDSSKERGADYKAMAVCSYHPYIHVWKPILLLALESYFSNPSISVLSNLFDSINAMDLSTSPSFTPCEKLILRGSERRDLFEERFAADTEAGLNANTGDDQIGLGLGSLIAKETSDSDSISVRSKKRNSARNSATTSIGESSIPETLALLASASISEDSIELVSPRTSLPSMPNGGIGGPIPNKTTVRNGPSIPGGRKKPKDTHYFEAKISFDKVTLPAPIPLTIFDEEIGEYSLKELIRTFSTSPIPSTPFIHPHLHSSGPHTHALTILFNAILTEKRVIFLGHLPTSSGKVASMVLAASAMGSGCGSVFRSGMTRRCFPYANLKSLEYLKDIPGFIAGVVNPIFEFNTSEWDLLLNIDTGRVIISKDIQYPSTSSSGGSIHGGISSSTASVHGRDVSEEGEVPPSAPPTGKKSFSVVGGIIDSQDALFLEEIQAKSAIEAHFSEQHIRSRWTEYLVRFIRLASKYEEEIYGSSELGFPNRSFSAADNTLGSGIVFSDGTTNSQGIGAREIEANAGRIEGWRRTNSYLLYIKWFKKHLASRSIQGYDPAHQLQRLRVGKKISQSEMILMAKTLAESISTETQVIELLSMTPSHHHGLATIALGLFHPSEEVRNDTTDLMDVINNYAIGKKFIQSLNSFHRLAYIRLSQERHLSEPEASYTMMNDDVGTLSLSFKFPPPQTPTGRPPSVNSFYSNGTSNPLGESPSPPPLPTNSSPTTGSKISSFISGGLSLNEKPLPPLK